MAPPRSAAPRLTARSGLLYGAALGLLAGLLYLVFHRQPEVSSILTWRWFVLGGAVAGMLAGFLGSRLRRD